MSYIGYSPASKPLTSADITDGIIGIADLSATGTPSSTTFLRGDNTWGSAGAAAGQVIQVVTATDSTQRSTSSETFVTASNTLSVSITPSSSSNKILIIVNSYGTIGTYSGCYTIYKNATTNLGNATYGFMQFSGSSRSGGAVSMHYLDSPATTSSTTYQVYMRVVNPDTLYLNADGCKGSITCLEIKG